MNFDANWQTAAAQMQKAFKGMAQQGSSDQSFVTLDAAKLQKIQQSYIDDASALWNQSLQAGSVIPVATDRRFSNAAWNDNPVSKFSAAAYLLNSKALTSMADAVVGDDKTKARVRFAIEQSLAATAPSNFMSLNADAIKKALDSAGQSIGLGIKNLLHDLQQGRVSMTDESQFEVGKNVATTEGAVVFENEFFQLLEYKALTKTVYEKPFLLVPPCINKFYILDLQPENSLIRYAAAQGHRTFVVSWRNPDESMTSKTWDDYIEHGAIKAIAVVQNITGAKAINTLGFCIGGTILATALSVLAARGSPPAASMTLLTSLLDFTDTGILDIFIDEQSVAYREQEMGKGGLLKGQDLASTFSFLRPNDLVWNYVVGNYLKGETPPPFDLLYWNGDATNLPGPFYAWYLRNTYFENNMIKPGKLTVCGQKIDLRKLDMPTYLYGSREDHIVPIGGAYASTQHLPGKKRFVMGASGHIAGVINPPAKNKRSYWTNDTLPANRFPAAQSDWQQSATEHAGSWWTDWSHWLKAHAGKQKTAPKKFGNTQYKAIEPAPGRYVKVKA